MNRWILPLTNDLHPCLDGNKNDDFALFYNELSVLKSLSNLPCAVHVHVDNVYLLRRIQRLRHCRQTILWLPLLRLQRSPNQPSAALPASPFCPPKTLQRLWWPSQLRRRKPRSPSLSVFYSVNLSYVKHRKGNTELNIFYTRIEMCLKCFCKWLYNIICRPLHSRKKKISRAFHIIYHFSNTCPLWIL